MPSKVWCSILSTHWILDCATSFGELQVFITIPSDFFLSLGVERSNSQDELKLLSPQCSCKNLWSLELTRWNDSILNAHIIRIFKLLNYLRLAKWIQNSCVTLCDSFRLAKNSFGLFQTCWRYSGLFQTYWRLFWTFPDLIRPLQDMIITFEILQNSRTHLRSSKTCLNLYKTHADLIKIRCESCKLIYDFQDT